VARHARGRAAFGGRRKPRHVAQTRRPACPGKFTRGLGRARAPSKPQMGTTGTETELAMAPEPERPPSLFHGGRDRVSFGGSGGDWEVLEDDDDEGEEVTPGRQMLATSSYTLSALVSRVKRHPVT